MQVVVYIVLAVNPKYLHSVITDKRSRRDYNSYNERMQQQLLAKPHQKVHHQHPNNICPAQEKPTQFFVVHASNLTIKTLVRKSMLHQ